MYALGSVLGAAQSDTNTVKTQKFFNIYFSQLHASFFTLIDGNLGVLKAILEYQKRKELYLLNLCSITLKSLFIERYNFRL